ncbi:MAG: WhiB family transcriptional regulator [Acidimicrobiales bacterium]
MSERCCGGQTALFFPPASERPQARLRREADAKAICAACPVQLECRTYARIHREHGVWGGENEDERIRAGFAPPHPIGSAARLRATG